jgi:deoxyribonuclease IV
MDIQLLKSYNCFMDTPIIGAHVSAAGGLSKAVDRALLIGAQAVQIFASPHKSFNPPAHSDESIDLFNQKIKENNLGPVFIHAIYLTNLASPNPASLDKTVASLTATMNFSSRINCSGVIFHTGSSLGAGFDAVRKQVVTAVSAILDSSPESSRLLIENAAGQGNTIGRSFEEVGALISDVGSARFKACLDTQHSFASGYNLRSKEGVDRLLSEWDQKVGLINLRCLHVNDSKVECGSNRDRHENIGDGMMGDEAFRLLAQNELLCLLPWILEVPGKDGKSGPDRENIDRLRSIALALG